LGKLAIDKETKDDFIELLKLKMIPEPVKIRADFKLTCYKFQGIDAIRAALIEGEKFSTEDIPIKVSELIINKNKK
jgi:translation initiation factor 2 subunit 1